MSSHLDANQLKLQNESLDELEFKELLQIAAKFASSELGRELILKSYPSNEVFWLRKEHNLIEEMTFIITEDDTLPLENLKDVIIRFYNFSLMRKIGSTLVFFVF